jgi:uncharacterized protein
MRTGVRQAYEPGDASSSVIALIVGLANGLRASGAPVSTGETLDAVRALAVVGPADRAVVRAALRATLIKEDAHEASFSRLFDLLFPIWSPAPNATDIGSPPDSAPDSAPGSAPGSAADLRGALVEALRRGDAAEVRLLLEQAVRQWAGPDAGRSNERHQVQRVLRRLDLATVMQQVARGDPDRSALQRRVDTAEAAARTEEVRRMLERLIADRSSGPPAISGAPAIPPAETDLADRHILRAGPDEIAALRATVRPLARRLATRLGRRRRKGRGRLDMRRTLRSSMSSGGVPLDPQLRRRSPTKPDLVILCDVSGSMAQFAPFALALLHALHAEFRRVRSWVFVDGIVEITDVLESASGVVDVHRLLSRRGLVAGDGRSDYARAFGAFLSSWGDLVTGRTTVLVVGDGRSHDRRPAIPEAAEVYRLARRMYWLNPEPGQEWNTGDSVIARYAAHCTQLFEVSTLRQLSACVAAIV